MLSWCLRYLASERELFWTALTTRQKKSIFPLLKNNRFVQRWFIGFWVSLKQIITPVHSKISTHGIAAQKMIGRRIEPRQKFYSCDNYGHETWAESWIYRQSNQSSTLTESHSLICASSHMLWQTPQTTVNFLLHVLLMGWERLQCLSNDLIAYRIGKSDATGRLHGLLRDVS